VRRYDLLDIYQAGLASVEGRSSSAKAIACLEPPGLVRLIAIGKSASAMTWGALDQWGEHIERGLLVTRYGYGDDKLAARAGFRQIESGHPIPDQRSLDAGDALLEFIALTPPSATLLMLISGGASSLVENIRPGMTLVDLQEANRWLLGSGLDIESVNMVRQRLSLIKGGRLRYEIGKRRCIALYISDVPGDDPALIGSGLLSDPPATELPAGLPEWLSEATNCDKKPVRSGGGTVEHIIIANLDAALQGCEVRARALGYEVTRHEDRLSGDVRTCASRIVNGLSKGGPGIHLWGGEATIVLPVSPGRGGRCQHLALSCALRLKPDSGHLILCAASDGCDGPGAGDSVGAGQHMTEDAGGLVDAQTIARGMQRGADPRGCLARADAGGFLAASGDLISTGPTGTNVTDLIIGLAGPAV
jgi:hydroxypyruvate reductase